MKVNQKQRLATRKKIIDAAVEIIISKGVKSATMREIAKSAGIGDATIYNYFPTKEAIIYGYYEDGLAAAMVQVNGIEGFDAYNLQEQLQSLLESLLTNFLADREFVQATFTRVFFGLSQNYNRLKPIRKRFIGFVKEILESAESREEIPEIVFADMLGQLFWDYYMAMVSYWLKDTSDQFANTTVLVDLSLDLTCTMIKSGFFNKAFSMATFLFKNHVLSRMDLLADKFSTISRIKDQFMGEADEDA
jgi:AcrR family transcriptional regulator